ncbi:hypothetical protein FOZ62_030405 [Perkinsus olseni]|uniref:Uncharacterized protein n=2 Tax=Perkinsus olseni TaxID=32597 RepID=A0A7J6S6Y0_PEROL|nr:hypothetical protein FOZ62_030405 [Perkinsus olseni]
MPPAETGILGNSWSIADLTPGSLVDGRVAPVSGAGELPPTIFHLAKSFSKEVSTASAYAWPWIHLMSASDVDHEFDGEMHDEGPVKFLFDLMITDYASYASGPDDQACSFQQACSLKPPLQIDPS